MLFALITLPLTTAKRVSGTVATNVAWQPLARFVFDKAEQGIVPRFIVPRFNLSGFSSAYTPTEIVWAPRTAPWGSAQWLAGGAGPTATSLAFVELEYPVAIQSSLAVQLIWDALPPGAPSGGTRPGLMRNVIEFRDWNDKKRWLPSGEYSKVGWKKVHTTVSLAMDEPRTFWIALVSSIATDTADCVCRVEWECASLCRRSLLGVEYHVDLRNGGFDGILSHFSFDEASTLPLVLIFLIAQIALIVFFTLDVIVLAMSSKLHAIAAPPFASVVMQLGSLAFGTSRALVLLGGGQDAICRVLQGGERVLAGAAEVTMVFSIIILAKGYAITRRKLGQGSWKKIGAFTATYACAWLLLFFWATIAYTDVSGEVVYYKEAPPGIVLVVLRSIAALWVGFAAYTSIKKGKQLSFFIAFMVLYIVWMVAPLIFWGMSWFDATGLYRAQIFWALDTAVTFVGQLGMVALFFPKWPFNISEQCFPFHAKGSAMLRRAAPAAVFGAGAGDEGSGGDGDGDGGSDGRGRDDDDGRGGDRVYRLRNNDDSDNAEAIVARMAEKSRIAHDRAEVQLEQSRREAKRLYMHAVSVMNAVVQMSNAIHEIELPDGDEEEDLSDDDEVAHVQATSFGAEDVAAVRRGQSERRGGGVNDRRELGHLSRAVSGSASKSQAHRAERSRAERAERSTRERQHAERAHRSSGGGGGGGGGGDVLTAESAFRADT
mgnify:FL=1